MATARRRASTNHRTALGAGLAGDVGSPTVVGQGAGDGVVPCAGDGVADAVGEQPGAGPVGAGPLVGVAAGGATVTVTVTVGTGPGAVAVAVTVEGPAARWEAVSLAV